MLSDLYYKIKWRDQCLVSSYHLNCSFFVFTEEVFSSNKAVWFSPSGTKLAFGHFDDSHTPVMNIPYYGFPGLTFQYPTAIPIHYPKVSGSIFSSEFANLEESACRWLFNYGTKQTSFAPCWKKKICWLQKKKKSNFLCSFLSACTTVFTRISPERKFFEFRQPINLVYQYEIPRMPSTQSSRIQCPSSSSFAKLYTLYRACGTIRIFSLSQMFHRWNPRLARRGIYIYTNSKSLRETLGISVFHIWNFPSESFLISSKEETVKASATEVVRRGD